MAGMVDERVRLLVAGLCATAPSLPMVKEEERDDYESSDDMVEQEVREDEGSVDMFPSVSYDKVLAELFEMGFEIEDSIRAIRSCGRLDVSAVIEHMNSETPTATAVAKDSTLVMPKMDEKTFPAAILKVKEEQEQNVSNVGTRVSWARGNTLEASTSSGHSIKDDLDDVKDQDYPPLHRRSLRPSEAVVTLKGKFPATATSEGYDHQGDSDRWECYDHGASGDKELFLLEMGFSENEVVRATEACENDADVNQLANYIMSNMVDLPEEDDDWDPFFSEGNKEVEPEHFKDWPSEELKDLALPLLDKLRSMDMLYSAKAVLDAIHACGKDATDETFFNYLLDSDKKKKTVGNPSKLEQLKDLGCASTAACLRAIDTNPDAPIGELLDYIRAEELSDEFEREYDELEREDDLKNGRNRDLKRKRKADSSRVGRPSKAAMKLTQRKEKKGGQYVEEGDSEEDVPVHVSYYRNLRGFGLPGESVIPRQLSEEIAHAPYFYFENVASMPKDEWRNIQRHLYNIAPEFVDSLNFSPCRRPRGYVHNLPLEGRCDVLDRPPMTVQELIPGSAEFWPVWDKRTKLNTINTRIATEFVRGKIHENVTALDHENLTDRDIKNIMHWAKKWNLVWVMRGILAPLRPEEIETCLGFDQHHTRAIYSSHTRVMALGNSFQVNTVAFHLSVLRPLYSSGIRVLSLFSGIGGAEVALHKLGIFLKVVVSVEINDHARRVVDSWWKMTEQKGTLIHTFTDVKQLDKRAIQGLIDQFGGFDLVIGGSPCNNLSGNNRSSRVGLAGSQSIAFFEFPRILAEVRDGMMQRRR